MALTSTQKKVARTLFEKGPLEAIDLAKAVWPTSPGALGTARRVAGALVEKEYAKINFGDVDTYELTESGLALFADVPAEPPAKRPTKQQPGPTGPRRTGRTRQRGGWKALRSR